MHATVQATQVAAGSFSPVNLLSSAVSLTPAPIRILSLIHSFFAPPLACTARSGFNILASHRSVSKSTTIPRNRLEVRRPLRDSERFLGGSSQAIKRLHCRKSTRSKKLGVRSMAGDRLGVPDDVTEFHDPPDVLQEKIKKLADLIKQSKRIVVYTGAGISTSTGIPDFRGPEGVWTLRAKGIQAARSYRGRIRPSLAHMALVELQKRGILDYVVSQNTDGLHRRSGIKKGNLAELHGNTNMEICRNCGREYWRPFSTREANGVLDHRTSRKCDKCGHQLHDTIINFSEALPAGTLTRAAEHSDQADLGLVLGTSMRVSPAADLPLRLVRRGKPLVIVNLQKTPADHLAALRIFGKTDEVMEGVMKELGYSIPPTYDLLDEPREKQPER